MPVNMDPKKRRPTKKSPNEAPHGSAEDESGQAKAREFGQETEEDQEKHLADAESKNLWDATEVIDMDKW